MDSFCSKGSVIVALILPLSAKTVFNCNEDTTFNSKQSLFKAIIEVK